MKKIKFDKEISEFSYTGKKAMILKHEMLFTPYKIQWKNSHSNPGNLLSSRTFFTTMKNQLSNLKSDVQKLIKKENWKEEKNLGNGTQSEDNSLSGSRTSSVRKYCVNDGRQFEQPKRKVPYYAEIPKLDDLPKISSTLLNNQNNSDNFNHEKLINDFKEKQLAIQNLQKQNQIQKNLIGELKRENYQLYREMESKRREKMKEMKQYDQDKTKYGKKEVGGNTIERSASLPNSHLVDKKVQTQYDERIRTYETKVRILNQQKQNLKLSNQELKNHVNVIEEKNQKIGAMLEQISGKDREKQYYIRELEEKLESVRVMQRQVRNDEWALKVKVEGEKEKEQKDKVKGLYRMQLEEVEYRYEEKVKAISQKYEQQIKTMEQANTELTNLLQLHQNGHMAKENQQGDYNLLGREFERKLNSVVEHNYELKNKIGSLESDVQRLEVEKQVLREEIRIYEEIRKQEKMGGGGVVEQEWKRVTDELYSLKKEKQGLTDQFELKIMRLENELESLKQGKNSEGVSNTNLVNPNVQSLNIILKEQLAENIQLRQRAKQQTKQYINRQKLIEQLEQKLKIVSEQLSIEKKKTEILKQKQQRSPLMERQDNTKGRDFMQQLNQLQKKYGNLEKLLNLKNKQLQARNQFIERVLISKTGKKEEEDELRFVLREIKVFGVNDQNYYY